MNPITSKTRFNLAYVLIAAMGVLILHDLWVRWRAVAVLPYSEFQQLLEAGKVKEALVADGSLQGELKEPLPEGPNEGKRRFVTARVDEKIAAELARHGVKFSGQPRNETLSTILSWVVPVLLFFGLWMFLVRRMAGQGGPGAGLMSIGKSKAKVLVDTDVRTRFADVAGVDEAKAELQEVAAFLRDPKAYGRLGARMPKGVLLVGPPGTGKTLLARAVFIDELDALGRARNSVAGIGGHDEKEQTLNQLLVELDGFDPSSGIVLLAATNRPEVLDPALLRAGRFDRQVLVDRPDRAGRRQILAVHVRKVTLADGVDLEQLAALTPGFTGADLANLVNEAALVATRRGADVVELADFTAAIERIVAGLEKKNRLLSPREREVVAHHEMGHAIVAAAQPGCDPVHKISIIPRGIGALGYTIQRPTEDRYLMTREELEAKMAVLLGGRAAELVVHGHLSTGAADDLARATDIARAMVTRYGMVPRIGAIALENEPGTFLGGAAPRRAYAEETAREIDLAIRELVQAAGERARRILEANREVLADGARWLLERETLADGELHEVLARVGPAAGPAVRPAA